MTEEQATLGEINTLIGTMPESDRTTVELTAEAIRAVIRVSAPLGLVALALVGAEMAAQELSDGLWP